MFWINPTTLDPYQKFTRFTQPAHFATSIQSSFQTDRDDSKSQSGYVFILNGGAVDWKSSKKSTVAQSTTKSEYIVASKAAREAMWIRKFVADLNVVPSIKQSTEMHCDNTCALILASDPVTRSNSRHILRQFHYIREVVKSNDIDIRKVHTYQNLADPFTKPMPLPKHNTHAEGIGLRFASSLF